MDDDIIFPAVSIGEEILSKYRDSTFCGQLQVIITLTNLRLLIRWRFNTCIFFSRSYYSSINLHSIHRVDEISSNPSYLLLFTLLIFFISGCEYFLFGIINGGSPAMIIIGLLLIIGSITVGVLVFFIYKRKYIHLKGTFGAIVLKLSIESARELEARLSELIYHRKMKRTLQQIKWQLQSHFSSSVLPSTPVYYNENEKRFSKIPTEYVFRGQT
jgi:hypothetical protein